MKARLIKLDNNYFLKIGDTTFATSATPNLSASIRHSISIKNCQAIERGYDLDELAKSVPHTCRNDEDWYKCRAGFIEGFQKALELMGDKKFSEEDVISMIEKSRETGLTAEYLILTKQQTEWDVEIEMEEDKDVLVDDLKQFLEELGDKPKLDADGCLILKRVTN